LLDTEVRKVGATLLAVFAVAVKRRIEAPFEAFLTSPSLQPSHAFPLSTNAWGIAWPTPATSDVKFGETAWMNSPSDEKSIAPLLGDVWSKTCSIIRSLARIAARLKPEARELDSSVSTRRISASIRDRVELLSSNTDST
jgi:hypothetical protein